MTDQEILSGEPVKRYTPEEVSSKLSSLRGEEQREFILSLHEEDLPNSTVYEKPKPGDKLKNREYLTTLFSILKERYIISPPLEEEDMENIKKSYEEEYNEKYSGYKEYNLLPKEKKT